MDTPNIPGVSCTPEHISENLAYSMAYVPYQKWTKTYDSDMAFERGTLFPCLDLPFLGEAAVPK